MQFIIRDGKKKTLNISFCIPSFRTENPSIILRLIKNASKALLNAVDASQNRILEFLMRVCNCAYGIRFPLPAFPSIASTAYVHSGHPYVRRIRAKWLGIVWKCRTICWHLIAMVRFSLQWYLALTCIRYTFEHGISNVLRFLATGLRDGLLACSNGCSFSWAAPTRTKSEFKQNDFVSFSCLLPIRTANDPRTAYAFPIIHLFFFGGGLENRHSIRGISE